MYIGSTEKNNRQKLGLFVLTSIVVSSMIGSGVDGLPQNMAENSTVGPVVIAWIICGTGMLFISRALIVLSNVRPDLQSGVCMYVRGGFGQFTAFNVAWGYWLMIIFSNIAFAIMVMNTLNYFLLDDLKGGNSIPSVIGASLLIWGFNFSVLPGTRIAGLVSTVNTLAKLAPLVVLIIILILFVKYTMFADNIWRHGASKAGQNLGSIFSQATSPLSVVPWSLIDAEEAIAPPSRAKNKRDVGKATFIGPAVSLIICLLVSTLPFDVLTQHELSAVPTPSTAGILKTVVGEWGKIMIILGVLTSVLTSWLAWTIIRTELSMVAAQNDIFPKPFSRKNVKGPTSVSFYINSVFTQIVVPLVYFSNDVRLIMLAISTLAVLPAYLMTMTYLSKLCTGGEYTSYITSHSRSTALINNIIGSVSYPFMFYASETKYLMMVPMLLTLDVSLFIWARKKDDRTDRILTLHELASFILLLVLDIIIFILLCYKTIYFQFRLIHNKLR